jgi:hypothetical protein
MSYILNWRNVHSTQALGVPDAIFRNVKMLLYNSVKLTTHFHLAPRTRMAELHIHSSIRLHGIVLNYSRAGTLLPYLVEMATQ